MDMCGAVKDPRLARLYTSKQRCMYEYTSCSIYVANREKAPEQKTERPVETNLATQSAPSGITVDCEFYVEGECHVMHRKLLEFEIKRCANYSQTCPLRERALRMRARMG